MKNLKNQFLYTSILNVREFFYKSRVANIASIDKKWFKALTAFMVKKLALSM